MITKPATIEYKLRNMNLVLSGMKETQLNVRFRNNLDWVKLSMKEQWQLLGELKKAESFLFETFPKINKINTPMGYILRNK
jgi:hypothetical protein